MTGRALVLSLVLIPLSGSASQSPEELPKSTSGIIRGTVTAAETGKPLRRASVAIVPVVETASRNTLRVSTNSLGNFEVRGVPEGAYLVSASRTGYLKVEYGQRYHRERGTTLEITGGAVLNRIDLALPRGGVLSGRVTDEMGEPFPGVNVTALEMRYRDGRRQQVPVGVSTSDDGGYFRISGLYPGGYQLVGRSEEMWRNDKKQTYGYASTYFPGGGRAQAQTINLVPSQQRSDLDFSLEASPTARISGRVQRPTGEPAHDSLVLLGYHHGGYVMPAARSTKTAHDGTFAFLDVPPGLYSLNAGSAFMVITVTGADIDGLTLIPKAGSTVTGSVVTEQNEPPPFSASGVRLFLVPAKEDERILPTVRLPAVNSDWSFNLSNVGGPFLFRIRGIPEEWSLTAVTLNDKDITDTPWDVPTGGQSFRGLKVVLTQRLRRVSGTVVDRDGKPTPAGTVVVFSEESQHWMVGSRHVRTARPDRSGGFSIAGLPPGTYRAIVETFIEDGQWEDPAFLETARDSAVRFALVDGITETVTLKIPSR